MKTSLMISFLEILTFQILPIQNNILTQKLSNFLLDGKW